MSRFFNHFINLNESSFNISELSKKLEELQDEYSIYNLNIEIVLNPKKQVIVDTFESKKLNQDTMTELQSDIIDIIEDNGFKLDYIDNIKGKIIFFIK